MPNENIGLSGTYKYFFDIITPNVHNCMGPILSANYYQYTDPANDTKVWRPSPPLYKPKADVLAYQQFVINKGFYCLILIEVVSSTPYDKDPDLLDFHNKIFEANRAECDRWIQWFRSANPTPNSAMDWSDIRIIIGENLDVFDSLPYAPKTLNPKRRATAFYTPQ